MVCVYRNTFVFHFLLGPSDIFLVNFPCPLFVWPALPVSPCIICVQSPGLFHSCYESLSEVRPFWTSSFQLCENCPVSVPGQWCPPWFFRNFLMAEACGFEWVPGIYLSTVKELQLHGGQPSRVLLLPHASVYSLFSPQLCFS